MSEPTIYYKYGELRRHAEKLADALDDCLTYLAPPDEDEREYSYDYELEGVWVKGTIILTEYRARQAKEQGDE